MGAVLGDDVMATAMLGRLLHRCHVVNIQGASYRMREYRAKRRAAMSAQEQERDKENNFQGAC